jgi:hypothetical protein
MALRHMTPFTARRREAARARAREGIDASTDEGRRLDNAGNCYLRTKGALTPAGQTRPLALQRYRTPCCNYIDAGVGVVCLLVRQCDDAIS